MKSTSEILERISKSSTNHKDGIFTRLYRYLLREDIYYAAYQKLYANKGAITKGIDDDTADGFGKKYVEGLIKDLQALNYQPKPVRREYIRKPNGKMRPLGIASFRDKLLQEVIRQILEAIYEPVFSDYSHGFRPGRSCHSCLKQLSSEFTGVVWMIEGDIKGCFDNIDHEKLIEILQRKIKDSKLINIIRDFLKAGYMEDWRFNRTYSGTPQGNILSPILANIYLNELDTKVMEIKAKFDKPRTTEVTEEFRELDLQDKRLCYKIKKAANDSERQAFIKELKEIRSKKLKVPRTPQTNKRLTYVRYADDWLIGICGTKVDCEVIKAEIKEYLQTELHLELSIEKTLITHSANRVRFLGYDVRVRRSQKVKGFKGGKKQRTLNYRVELTAPLIDKVQKFMFVKGAVRQKNDGEIKSMHRAELLNLADYEILEHYNAEVRGILGYYHLACNYNLLKYFRHMMEYSCLKTLANKHKSSVKKIIDQYRCGKTWAVPYVTNKGTKMRQFVKLSDCKHGYCDDVIPTRKHYNFKTTIQQRLAVSTCELCGKSGSSHEVHVVRSLKELKGKADWEITMKQKHRKTLVVCSDCHSKIHG